MAQRKTIIDEGWETVTPKRSIADEGWETVSGKVPVSVQKPIRPLEPITPPVEAEGQRPSLKSFLDIPLDIGVGVEQSFGIDPMHPLDSLPSPKTKLLDLIKAVPQGIVNIPSGIGEAIMSGGRALREGNVPEAAQAVGRGAALGGIAKGGISTAIEGATRGAGAITGMLPSTVEAGPKFAELRTRGANVPFDVSKTQPIAARATELKAAGSGPLPSALSEYIKREKPIRAKFGGQRVSMSPDPIMLPEAMDRYSAARRQSSLEAAGTSPAMQGQLEQFAKALREGNREAFASIGSGELFDQAMKEYRQAKTIQDVVDVVKKWGPKAILGTGLGYELWKSH